jgi:hypothetical protein
MEFHEVLGHPRMVTMIRWYSRQAILLLLGLLIGSNAPPVAIAGPPAYLVLRRQESPQRKYQAGYPDAARYDARSSGYAYGWFGAAPRAHAARHFGYYRTYSQWSGY